MNKKNQKTADTVESDDLKKKNYHLLKKIFIENNDSKFSFIKNTKIIIHSTQLLKH